MSVVEQNLLDVRTHWAHAIRTIDAECMRLAYDQASTNSSIHGGGDHVGHLLSGKEMDRWLPGEG